MSGAVSGRRYFGCVAVIAPLVALWSVATPLGAAYDEHQHLWRAAAIVRGQFLPPDVQTPSGTESILRVPGGLVSAIRTECTAFKRNLPASCGGSASKQQRTETVIDSAGRYPPAYYLAVGWPTFIAHGDAAAWAARAVSAIFTIALLALALTLLGSRRPSRAGPLGFAIALTPMCVFLGGVVNPSGVEIAAALAAWAALLCLADHQTPTIGLLWSFGGAAAVLVVTRPVGPLMLAIVVAIGLLLEGADRLRALARDRRFRAPLGLIVLAGLSQLAWLAVAGAPHLTRSGAPHYEALPTIVNLLMRQGDQVRLMIGRFGWGETPTPFITHVAWTIAAAMLAFVAVRRREYRRVGVVLLLAASIVGVQIMFDVIYLNTLGPFWGARYSMPLAVGIPLMLADRVPAASAKTLARCVLPVVAVGHLAAFWWALHRFTVGLRKPLFAHPSWQPPVGAWPAVAMFAAAVAGYTVFLASGRPSTE